MFEQILDLVKGQVSKTVGGIDGIPAGKVPAVVETTASSLMDGLKKNASSEGLGALLGGGGGGGMAGTLTSGVVGALTSKLKLNPELAQTIASKVIPAVTSILKKKVDDKNEPGFNIESIIGGLGGGVAAGSGGGLGNMLGGLFGKKK